MNLDQIEAFIYAALTGSFSKAGEILFLTQPSVSLKIKTLEKEIGVNLFERSGKSIYLSKEGKDFLPYAQEIVKNVQSGISSVQKRSDSLNDEVSIAAVFSGVSYLLPKILNRFHQKHDNIKPIIYTGHSDQVLKMVLENQVSLGVVRSVFHSKIESLPLMKDEMVIAYHPEHPFHKTKEINIEDVAKTPLILFKRETLDWTLIHNAFEKSNLSPNIIVEVDSIEGAKQMVKENMGVSILPRFSMEEELESNSLNTADITGMPTIYRNFDLIYVQENPFDEATSAFFNFLKDKFKG